MKRLITIIGPGILICLAILPFMVPLTAQAHVELTQPNGGEQLKVGSIYTISWVQQIYHSTYNYDLSYSTTGSGGPWTDIVLNIPTINGSGGTVYTYEWTIPNDLSDLVRVRVIQDNPGLNYTGINSGNLSIVAISTGIEEFDIDNLPSDFNMSQNYPNPFNPITTFEFNLPKQSNVSISIYNLLGREIKQLINQEYSAGNYRITWDGTTSDGVQASTGIYFYRIETEGFVETKKMLLLK